MRIQCPLCGAKTHTRDGIVRHHRDQKTGSVCEAVNRGISTLDAQPVESKPAEGNKKPPAKRPAKKATARTKTDNDD